MPSIAKHEIVSFGLFEVDLDEQEVRKAGLRVRLAGQPYRLLATLLTRPGEVFSREELHREIWGQNVNVDFERGLASAINKVRDALGDSADHPIYIETVARRGYRFIAPVSVAPRSAAVDELPPAPASVRTVSSPLPLAPTVELAPPGEAFSNRVETSNLDGMSPVAGTLPGLRRHALRGSGIAAAVCLVIALAALSFWIFRGQGSVATMQILPRIEQITQTNDITPGPPNQETILSLVSDGPRLYVPVLVNGQSQLASFAVDGTYRTPLVLPSSLSTGAITAMSQDGSRLLVRSLISRDTEQPLWIVPTTGTGAQRIGEILAHDASWMPNDPESILYAFENELRVFEIGTGNIKPFASLPGRAFWLRWSPDGHTLRFTLLNPLLHSTELWQLDMAQRKPHPMPIKQLNSLQLCCGSWTGDGKHFVFQASDAHSSNLWLADANSPFHLKQLTNGPNRFQSPLPSRDGTTVFAFGSTQPGTLLHYDAVRHVIAPAGLFLERGQRVAFSRDGNWVAWTDDRGFLWRARAQTGADLLQLTGDSLEVFSAQWSPDGSSLVLMGRHPGQSWRIFTVNASGGAVTSLLTDNRNLADPSWSADGKQIVFGGEADLMGKETGSQGISVLNLATHKIQSLPNSANLFSPRWSPDGEWIAALSRDQARLVLYSVRTGQWTTLFTGGAADPVWTADSQFIEFHAFAPDKAAILQVSTTGVVRTILNLNELGPGISNNCFFSGIMPDGSPLMKPHVGAGNLYTVSLPAAP